MQAQTEMFETLARRITPLQGRTDADLSDWEQDCYMKFNMALMHGPIELCWYNEEVRYVVFMAVGTAAINTEASLIANGHRLAADLEFAKPYQRIVWARDDLPALTDAFAMMEQVLSSSDRQFAAGPPLGRLDDASAPRAVQGITTTCS